MPFTFYKMLRSKLLCPSRQRAVVRYNVAKCYKAAKKNLFRERTGQILASHLLCETLDIKYSPIFFTFLAPVAGIESNLI